MSYAPSFPIVVDVILNHFFNETYLSEKSDEALLISLRNKVNEKIKKIYATGANKLYFSVLKNGKLEDSVGVWNETKDGNGSPLTPNSILCLTQLERNLKYRLTLQSSKWIQNIQYKKVSLEEDGATVESVPNAQGVTTLIVINTKPPVTYDFYHAKEYVSGQTQLVWYTSPCSPELDEWRARQRSNEGQNSGLEE
ncbi:hypothetical protein ADEAN_000555500 [Angomonas deanei]|uniref:Uncharacterized protein n=1 Tax=Angomonas deanei TaxID=59799 RepID=A0A7G2CEV4_9TRYP|nr:hypothetical protein ADEAN_000555500 [Angomonas deanei]